MWVAKAIVRKVYLPIKPFVLILEKGINDFGHVDFGKTEIKTQDLFFQNLLFIGYILLRRCLVYPSKNISVEKNILNLPALLDTLGFIVPMIDGSTFLF